MKRAVLLRFGTALLMALVVSSCISYYFMSNRLLEDNERHMLDMIHMVDYSMDYTGDMQQEILRLRELITDQRTRITVIRRDGMVCADTDEASEQMENHLEREEIEAALLGKVGVASRYSETVKENMLYVAALSGNGEYVLRVAVVYTGLRDYLPVIVPVLIVSVLVAFGIAAVVSTRFANTITEPLGEISTELQKVHTDSWDFHFRHYKYEELNIISDATIRLSEEVKAHISRLEFEKKVRQEFFSNASHELKTPITAIRGYAELLDNGFVKDEETRQKFIRRILKSTENMTRLIDDILMISRLETKDAEVTFSMVQINLLLDEIFDSVESIAQTHQVTLHKECEPVVIEASIKQMRELLMNLIVNGIKYNRMGGNVWVYIGASGHDMVVRVKDDGMGISADDQSRIFERFYRVDKGRSRKLGGTGLGLSIVKHIVEYYDGYMRLSSRLNEGSEFTISLPLMRQTEENF